MKNLRVAEQRIWIGELDGKIEGDLVQEIRSIPQRIFFNSKRQPLMREIKDLDLMIAEELRKQGWMPCQNHLLFGDSRFNIDLACEKHKILIEIEKGKLPRLELDILKIAGACYMHPDKWRFGALVVPSTYIKLPLASRDTSFKYAKRLKPVLEPVVKACNMQGFLVVGYEDPRQNEGIHDSEENTP